MEGEGVRVIRLISRIEISHFLIRDLKEYVAQMYFHTEVSQ